MRKIVDYEVVANDLKNINLQVKGMIKDGWQPWGSGLMLYFNDCADIGLAQPMIKYEE